MLDLPASSPPGRRRGAPPTPVRRGAGLLLVLLLGSAACRVDAPPPPDAEARAAAPQDSALRPEPPPADTTWVRLATLRSDAAQRARRRAFRSASDGFRIIIELRDPTTTMSLGRLVANVLSPTTTLPIRTLETQIAPGVELRADTTFVDAAPGRYTLYILHDFGVRGWSVTVEAPRIEEETR